MDSSPSQAVTLQTRPEQALPVDGALQARRVGRIGAWALLIFFGGFLLWAAFAPLDEGVPAQGMVVLDTKRKAVQHLSGGIVKEVLVGEGEKVSQGQLLMRLDDAVSRANYEDVRQRYLGLRAMQGRLQAEQAGAAKISFHPDLRQAASDPQIQLQMLNQEQLFATRRDLLRSDLQSMQESIGGLQGQLSSYGNMLRARESQAALVHEQLQHLRGLVEQGYAPRNQQLDLERQTAEINANMADLRGNIVRAERAIAETRQRALSRERDFRREVETQLADVNRQVLADELKLKAVTEELDRTRIRSPAEGQVVGLAVQTVGAVITPGQKLMDIVPDDEVLLLEVQVPPGVIDRVHAGLTVDVRFNSFAHSPQLVVPGEVLSVSQDLLVDQRTGVSYYLARVRITPEGMTVLGKRQLQAGMPTDVVVKTGERSMLKYLVAPLIKRMASSMKEE